MDYEKTKINALIEALERVTDDSFLTLFNEYCESNKYEEQIRDICEFDNAYGHLSPSELIRQLSEKDVREFNDANYFYEDAYGFHFIKLQDIRDEFNCYISDIAGHIARWGVKDDDSKDDLAEELLEPMVRAFYAEYPSFAKWEITEAYERIDYRIDLVEDEWDFIFDEVLEEIKNPEDNED